MHVHTIVAAGLLLTPIAAFAQGAGWIADARTGCNVANANPQPDESVTWSGGCVNGVAQGHGVLQWYENKRPAERYEGDMRGGDMSGNGVLVSGDGGHFEGTFRNGKADGLGTWTSPRETLTGTWVNGCFNDGKKRAAVGVDPRSCP